MQNTATMPEVQTTSVNLSDKTVLLHLSLGTIGNSRKVTNRDAGISDADLVNLNKKLLLSPELEAIRSADGDFRRMIDRYCLPYEESGIRILSLAAVSKIETKIREYVATREPLVERFLSVYRSRMLEAESRLSRVQVGDRTVNLFRASDYFTESEARERFYIVWHYRSLGETPNSLAGISPELFDAERQKAQQRMESAADEITAVMRATLAELVGHLKDKLTPGPDGKEKILRTSAITNLTEFLETFDLRNVTNDAELAKLADDCRKVISQVPDAEVLRNVSSLRARVSSDLAGIQTELDKLVADKPSRKFRFDE